MRCNVVLDINVDSNDYVECDIEVKLESISDELNLFEEKCLHDFKLFFDRLKIKSKQILHKKISINQLKMLEIQFKNLNKFMINDFKLDDSFGIGKLVNQPKPYLRIHQVTNKILLNHF